MVKATTASTDRQAVKPRNKSRKDERKRQVEEAADHHSPSTAQSDAVSSVPSRDRGDAYRQLTALKSGDRVDSFLLRLLAHVEDRAILRRAEDILCRGQAQSVSIASAKRFPSLSLAHLMQRTLATLALRPQAGKGSLGLGGERDLPSVEFGRLWSTVIADCLIC